MKKTIYLVLILSTIFIEVKSQKAAKSIFVGVGGPAALGVSIDYDTRFSKRNDGLGMKIGTGMVLNWGNYGYVIPLELNYLFPISKERSFLEMGVGASYFYSDEVKGFLGHEKESLFYSYLWLGYRYQPPVKGFTFRAGLCPLLGSINSKFDAVPFAGLSIGYKFK